ncbi:MAG: molybdopterin synthase [Hyphomonadaceae bacterium BRH_c29]|nr:MAG: molybdopterin synthase [Hyphomonadaceae bacterium BRH_c29]
MLELRERAVGHGALVSFEGIVRPVTKQGEALDRLVLDHHPRMTASSLDRIARDGAARFDVRALSVVHRAGAMVPGEIIVLVAVASDHRRDAFRCADYLMDRLKTEAVFWKREQGPFGERWIEPTQRDTEDRERWNEENAGY